MTDNRTTELLCRLLRDRGVEYTTRDGMKATSITHITHWYADGVDAEFTEQIKGCTRLTASGLTPEQAIAATLGSYRDEIYNAGFDNGVKACLQILDGYLAYPHSAAENIQKWVDEQWEEYGA